MVRTKRRVVQLLSTLAASLAVVALFATGWVAAVPPGFNVQGRLTDAAGVNRNGSHSLKFTIFDASSGGVPLWTNTLPSVSIRNGQFQVVVGDVGGQRPMSDVFGGGDSRFLEIQVLSGPGITVAEPPMVPRQQLVSVPFALRAETVANASVLTSTSSMSMATAGAERVRVTSDGKVGVGTAQPAFALDVAGDINVSGNVLKNGAPLQAGGLAFGGLFMTAGSPSGTCVWKNPATDYCSCPVGFNDSAYPIYEPGGLNCGWLVGYTAQAPCYGQWNYLHQCWK